MTDDNQLQPRLIHAALYASLMLQVARELYPAQTLFTLSPDQRRIATNEAELLLLQARWRVESLVFARTFGSPPPPPETPAPPKTELGRPPDDRTKAPGQYV